MKKSIFAFMFVAALALLLPACGSSDSDKESNASSSETVSTTPESAENSTTPEPTKNLPTPEPTDPVESPAAMSLDDLCSLIQGVIEEDYDGCTVTHDESMLAIECWADGVASELAGGTASVKDSWDAFIENSKELLNSVSNLIKTSGNEGVGASFCLLNDLNHENILLSIVDGVVIYNAMDEAPAPSPTSEETTTIGQRNALSKANQYLSIMAFSYSGLIDQLEYEGYTTEEATYGADNCGADWNEQAAKKAQQYIDLMSFSRQGLIDQLKFDGFTQSQAEYGVSAVGY